MILRSQPMTRQLTEFVSLLARTCSLDAAN
jgi:hypothetical protein